MATAYQDIYSAGTDSQSVLRQQTTVACLAAAIVILDESSETANHTARFAWARAVMRDPTALAARAVWVALKQSAALQTAPLTSSDADVQAAVDVIVNTLAAEL